MERSVKLERNNGSTKEANNDHGHDDHDESREVSIDFFKFHQNFIEIKIIFLNLNNLELC